MKNSIQVKLVHAAIDKMFKSVETAGHTVQSVNNITVTRRFNRQTGDHVHATCSVKLRFDESVSESDIPAPLSTAFEKY